MFQLPISEYPELVPPSVVVRAQYPGANPKVIAETRRQPDADGQLQAGRGPGQGAAAGAEPRVASAAAPAAGRAAPGRDHRQELAHADAGRALDLAQ
ncbi:hypothetical protein G6F55_014280 [Rhizopus delemar]|nr:hypothetical protein G6F55_014280 [Rhizopus delemar]